MKNTRAAWLARFVGLVAVGVLGTLGAESAPATTADAAAGSSRVTFADESGDVRKPKLDIRDVRVVNKPDVLKVRVYFPGVDQTYGFPTGAVMVYLDTVEAREGPEYGHFMDFWSDYRFAPTEEWSEQRVRAWSHSPEGRCVADAGVKSDRKSRLQWFEYVVLKRDRCFEAAAVRVAVSTVNTGELRPFKEYRKPAWDYLTGEHEWTDWVPQAS
ncbi:hypothetical protein [Nocardioides bigeumensis]|uniref:Uncharacterized protein n=1 Tax=Nocardioides bigeumensis TaxID=433657 RepID=A0ABN2XLJ0_9ACTN